MLFPLLFAMLCISSQTIAQQANSLDEKISLKGGKQTIYSHLNEISDASGLMFIYDTKLVRNDKKIKIDKGERTIRKAIMEILQDPDIVLENVGKYILIRNVTENDRQEYNTTNQEKRDYKIIRGRVINKETGEQLPFCTIYLNNSSLSTISNLNGDFELKIPDSLANSSITISFIGFKPKTIPTNIIESGHNAIQLEPQNINLKELIIREVNPEEALEKMIDNRKANYINLPAYYTTYYREGTEYKSSLKNFTEAVFKIYKSSPDKSFSNDQVKLLRKRTLKNRDNKDTIDAKIIAGIDACLKLDIIKNLPDFLLKQYNLYKYSSGRSELIDSNIIDVVYFEPMKNNNESLYKGTLFINSKNSALIRAEIELSPKNIDKAAESFVAKQGKILKIIPDKISYIITYRLWNNQYHVNHIRGDLYFKVKKQRKWFSSSLLHSWFEMVTCKISTTDVSKFQHKEAIATQSIFSEEYDGNIDTNFWGDLNIIPWEEELSKNISSITAIIEKIVTE